MGFETVWQLLGWVGYTWGVPLMIVNTLSTSTKDYYTRHYGSRSNEKRQRLFPFPIPWWSLLLIWSIVTGSAALGAFWVHDDGDWTVHPIPLLSYCFTIIAAVYWVPLFYSPCKEKCNYITTAIFIAFLLNILTFILFLGIRLISGFLMIPLLVWLVVNFYMVWRVERACRITNYPVRDKCKPSWSKRQMKY